MNNLSTIYSTLVVALTVAGSSGQAHAAPTRWNAGSAYTLEKGRIEMGIFAPLRYGVSERLEIKVHPLVFLVAPHLEAKIGWQESAGWQLSSQHSVWFPGGLYEAIAREGTGGLLPIESQIPHMVAVSNHVLASRALSESLWITGKLGLTLGGKVGRSNVITIDLPVIYPRMAAQYDGVAVNAGFDIDGRIGEHFGYFADVDLFVLPLSEGKYGVEHSAALTWHATQDSRLLLGYKMTYQAYPYGAALNLGGSPMPLPMVDWQWGW